MFKLTRQPVPPDRLALTYYELRSAVGYIAIGLPLGLVALVWFFHRNIQDSISAYYYTEGRNLFVGALCAIALFQFCCRGYDERDHIAGAFSALFAIGVAFFPTKPEDATSTERAVGIAHYAFAFLLFSTLAYFCLRLFTISDAPVPTPQKHTRNRVYVRCGIIIILSMVAIALCAFLKSRGLMPEWPSTLVFETTALFAFGFAWLVKGQTLFADRDSSQHEMFKAKN